VQYNLMNRTTEPVIDEAARLGIGVIAMGPLHGGIFAARGAFFDALVAAGAGESPAEVAFRFVLSNPKVACAISGMTSSSDVESNRRIAERTRPLTSVEMAAVGDASVRFAAGAGKVCTLCEYCMPCPQDIWIPGVLTLFDAARLLGLEDEARRQYKAYLEGWAEKDSDGAPCIECGQCVERCPQGIEIPVELKRAHKLLK
jgi:predicted aldo/keto reductase-like oxidoreductase